MRRLVASGMLPDRAGQPARVWAHISLADLMVLDADSALQEEWIARVRAQWAAARAAASVGGGDGAAWLEGKAAEGFACDAAITPVVTGEVNPAVLEDLIRLCTELAGHVRPGRCGPGRRSAAPAGGAAPGTASAAAVRSGAADRARPRSAGKGDHRQGSRPSLRPRRSGFVPAAPQLRARLGGPSLPLDVGYSEDVPAGIRNAVRLRDQHCR